MKITQTNINIAHKESKIPKLVFIRKELAAITGYVSYT
jgi:hypothetical protein